jgi:hypothetical protein
MMHRCFACDRLLDIKKTLVRCADEQTVFVGDECYRRVKAAGETGYQPPKGGPRLYLLEV